MTENLLSAPNHFDRIVLDFIVSVPNWPGLDNLIMPNWPGLNNLIVCRLLIYKNLKGIVRHYAKYKKKKKKKKKKMKDWWRSKQLHTKIWVFDNMAYCLRKGVGGGWSGGAKVSCNLRHRGVQLILA